MKNLVKKFVVIALMVSLLAVGSVFAQNMDGLININTADQATLVKLDHIGKSRAQAIVQYRQEHGSFSTVEQLKAVPGIGTKIFEAIKARITVGEG